VNIKKHTHTDLNTHSAHKRNAFLFKKKEKKYIYRLGNYTVSSVGREAQMKKQDWLLKS